MLLQFDIVEEAIAEHDDWHTHEHLPERLAIPGFIRGTRWVALQGRPRYFVMYEVEQLAVLTSQPYLERLNNPSPWTTKIMPSYRGMNRGLCSVAGSFGFGIGHAGLLIRFKARTGAEGSARNRLLQDILPGLPSKPGIGSAHLFEGSLAAPMTNEQRIRGADAGVDSALLVTGYSQDALAALAQAELGNARLEAHGASGIAGATYRLDYSLAAREVRAAP
ncbi:MAG TPA: hypothetical protein VFB53_07865 [Burkholderiales bacterium]|nr:hypothetical protein [Burkholderiales bacterium]